MRIYGLLIGMMLLAAAPAWADSGGSPGRVVVLDSTFGAVSSNQATTISCTVGTAATLGATKDFHVGDAIVASHCGPASTVSAQTISSVVSSKWASATPYTTTADGSGTQHYSMSIVSLDGKGGTSAVSATTNITNGAATLSGDAFNVLTTGGEATGAAAYLVGFFTNASANGTPTPYYVIADNHGVTPVFNDWGTGQNANLSAGNWQDGTAGTSMPPAAQADNLNTTIADCGATTVGALCTSTSIHLAVAATTSTTNTLFTHDNEPAFASATALLCSGTGTMGGKLIIPPGDYEMGQTWKVQSCQGLTVEGTSANFNSGGSRLLPTGGVGMTVIQWFRNRESYIRDLQILGASAVSGVVSDPGVSIDIDSSGSNSASTNDEVYNVGVGESGEGIRLANTTGTNNDMMNFTKNDFFDQHYASYWINNANAYFPRFTLGQCGGAGWYGIQISTGTSFTASNCSFLSQYAVWNGSCNTAAINLLNVDTEGSLRLYVGASTSCQQPVIVDGARLTGLDADGNEIVMGAGTLIFRGNNVSALASGYKHYYRDTTGTGRVQYVGEGNTYPASSQPYNGSNGATFSDIGSTIGTTAAADVQALATFGTCGAPSEGQIHTQNNSTAACSAGATATSAGTTHCQIRCNGTNWIQTGL